MKTHLNTLFVTLEGAYLRKDGAAVDIRLEGKSRLRVPLHNLDGIVCFGWDTTASAALMAACSEANVALSFHTPHGKFLASTHGCVSGNIALRRAQYRRSDSPEGSLLIARNLVAAKLANSRRVLLRGERDHGSDDPESASPVRDAADALAGRIRLAQHAETLDALRGVEGEGAAVYFGAFSHLLTDKDSPFEFANRSRRPPADPVNALLSFLYTLLTHDCRSALESVGLDPQCGFLHRDRPGRPSLALDLMEEFRPILADRAALTLINRRQLGSRDFELKENGGYYLKDESRKTVLAHWQERKQTEILHPFLDETTTIGLLPQLQARLLAKCLRGDIDAYPAFLAR